MKLLCLTALLVFTLMSVAYAEDTYFWDGERKFQLSRLDSPDGEKSDITRYRTSNGAIVGVTDQLILKLTGDYALQPYLDEFQLILVRALGEHSFLLEAVSHKETVKVCRLLACQNGVEYAHPDFLSQAEPR